MAQRKKPLASQPYTEIIGGRVHNLKNISLRFPHRQLIVVTGVSGSGKSSLVFHLLYAESHRRYMSTLESVFIRNFVDQLERPDVHRINGLQAVIGIGQDINRRHTLRSTVGTLTDILSFLRLLYARIAQPYSYLTGKKMISQTELEIQYYILKNFSGQYLTFIAPLIQGRKGHYGTLFTQLYKKGFRKVIINGELSTIRAGMKLGRYQTHDIQVIVEEKVLITPTNTPILDTLIKQNLDLGKGNFSIETTAGEKHYFSRFFMDKATGLAYGKPIPSTFSFNSPQGACATCKGLGKVHVIDTKQLIPDPKKSIAEGGISLLGNYDHSHYFRKIEHFLLDQGYNLHTPIKELPKDLFEALLYDRKVGNIPRPAINLPRVLFRKSNRQKDHKHTPLVQIQACAACEGKRLTKEACHFKIHGKSIVDLSLMSLNTLQRWLIDLPTHLTKSQQKIATNILSEGSKKIQLLLDMGLHYLSLDRPLQSLSGGEIRRVRVATQIGTNKTNVVGILYMLDEPSMCLHSRDKKGLIKALQKLRDLGNTVMVIEHDKEMMHEADFLIEVGPGAGEHGGEIVAAAPPKEFLKSGCVTAAFLAGEQTIPIPPQRRSGNGKILLLKSCSGRTLKNVNLKVPLGKFIAVTGVSGSGKSTLIHSTLVPAVHKQLNLVHTPSLPYKSVKGLSHINKIIEITQSPIGRTQRSNVLTYIQLLEPIRNLFAQSAQAKIYGYKAKHFSFNVQGGRCEACKGSGSKLVELDFLPSVRILCKICDGRLYNREVLGVHYKGKSIADVFEMTVEQAMTFFQHHPLIITKLRALDAVALGYIRLGQNTTTLSGGEAQRVKLASELTKRSTGKTLYVLDEPTKGLHFQDIKYLIDVLQRLVDKGNTVLCIEHNLDLVKVADYVIDLGPEGGAEGGYIIAEGTPEEVANNTKSSTGLFLKQVLAGKA